MTSTSDTAPGYFGDAARAAWNEITAGRDLHGAGDRLRAEQAALLLAEAERLERQDFDRLQEQRRQEQLR